MIVIAVLAVAALLLSFIGLWRGVRGAWLRGLALAALLAAIANPLLTQEERAWLDAYHARVREELMPALEGADRVWLEQATRPVGQ